MFGEPPDGADGVHDGGGAGGKRCERSRGRSQGNQVHVALGEVHLRQRKNMS